MSEGASELNLGRAQSDGNAAFDEADRGSTGPVASAPLAFGSGQVMAPRAVIGAPDLIVDERVDALVTDPARGLGAGQPTGDLFGRPAALEAVEDEVAQLGIAFQTRALPATGGGPLLGVGGLVADLYTAIAPQLARDARCRAIQSCCDLAERPAGLVKLGNLAPLFQAELAVVFPHRNTLSWCCTSFVNWGTFQAAGMKQVPAALRPDRAARSAAPPLCRAPCDGRAQRPTRIRHRSPSWRSARRPP